MPATTTAVKIARGMLRVGLSVSSPSEAAPSNPPKDRKPKTAAIATVENGMPPGGEKTSSVKSWSLGAEPPRTFARITTISTMISSTESPSMPSSERVATRMSPKARSATNTIATSAMISQSTLAGAEPVEERLPEQPDLGRRGDREQRVGGHQREPGEEPRPRPERRPGEREHRARPS